MTRYSYEALAPQGHGIKGEIEADSLAAALSLLRDRGISPFKAEPVESKSTPAGHGRMSLDRRAQIIRQLAILLAAGITLDRALRILSSQARRPKERAILDKVLSGVAGGQRLSTSLTAASPQFQADETGLIRAGEQSGSLVPVLEELATLLERRVQLRGKLASALVYPVFLLALAPISLIVIATVLVPNIAPLFENSGAAMPFSLRAMVWASDEFHARGVLWLAVAGASGAGLTMALRNAPVRARTRSLLGRLPLVRTLRRRTEASRICRTLGSLLRSGAPLQAALASITDVVSDIALRKVLGAVQQAVSGGEKLAVALRRVPALDSSALQMIAIGEETNKLDSMLLHVAETEEKALSNQIDRLMTLLVPLLTIAMGLFVGGIVMSIMRAILSVNDLVIR